MSYAGTDDVNKLLGPHKITTSVTKVTLSDLVGICQDISDQIDATLKGSGVAVVPSVDPVLEPYLGVVCSWGAAAQALKGLFPEAVGQGESPAYAFWNKKFEDALERLRTGEDIPASIQGSVVASSYFTVHVDEEPIPGESIGLLAGKPLFTVDDKDEHPW